MVVVVGGGETMSATDEPVHGVNIRVKSLSHYGFISCRREVSGGQMEAQILCSHLPSYTG